MDNQRTSIDLEKVLDEYEDEFRRAGLVSFCRRAHLRTVQAIILLGSIVVCLEIVLLMPQKSWAFEARILSGVAVFVLGYFVARTLQNLEHVVKKAAGRYLTETGFVLAPFFLMWGIGGLIPAVEIASLNLLLLVFYIIEEKLGTRFVLSWAVRFAYNRLRGTLRATWRTVPVLTVVLFAMFGAGETWQISSGLSVVGFIALILLLTIGALAAGAGGGGKYTNLRKAERVNIWALGAVSTMVVAFVGAFLFSVFLLIMGSLLVNRDILESWTGSSSIGFEINIGLRLTMTVAHLKMAALMGAIAGFVFSTTLQGNETYRALSNEALDQEIQNSVNKREEYLEVLQKYQDKS